MYLADRRNHSPEESQRATARRGILVTAHQYIVISLTAKRHFWIMPWTVRNGPPTHRRRPQGMTQDDRLSRQIAFVVEIDKLKHVLRQTWLTDQSRRENDAEHTWHFAVMAMLLPEYAHDEGLDLLRVLKMVLVHDLVEIDAGDTFAYDEVGAVDKLAREQTAADRLFSILPEDQAAEFRRLWDEFEARRTPEARYAAALDRLQPLLHNYYTQGRSWREHGVTADQVLARNAHMAEGAPVLWAYVEDMVRDAVEKGYLAE